MTCGHLFNGIGGFPLAASWMGWENVMHCEIDQFCNRVMNHHFPNSYQHEDIRTTDFTIWRGRIDLLTGGFPCQPYSTAGKRQGTADDRHLWPEMLRAIREISPHWIVAENVRGLVNWNGGMVFDQVQADMEAQGYAVIPFVLPAAGVGAPHRRDRIWFIAYRTNARVEVLRQRGQDAICKSEVTSNSDSNGFRCNHGIKQAGCQAKEIKGKAQREKWDEMQRERDGILIGGIDAKGVASHSGRIFGDRRESDRSENRINNRQDSGWEEEADKPERLFEEGDTWQNFPTQSPVCAGYDGVSAALVDFTVPSRKYGKRILRGKQAFGKWRNESLRALGNAIVPQVALQIFKAIEQYESI